MQLLLSHPRRTNHLLEGDDNIGGDGEALGFSSESVFGDGQLDPENKTEAFSLSGAGLLRMTESQGSFNVARPVSGDHSELLRWAQSGNNCRRQRLLRFVLRFLEHKLFERACLSDKVSDKVYSLIKRRCYFILLGAGVC